MKNRSKKFIRIILTTSIFLAGLGYQAGCSVFIGLFHRSPDLEAGELAPDLVLPLADGGELKLVDLRGQTVLIQFWAAWCGPCRGWMPEMADEMRDLGKRNDLTIIAISLDQDRSAFEKAVTKFKLEGFVHIYSGAGFDEDQARIAFRVNNIPQGILIDPTGIIVETDMHIHPSGL